MYWTIFVDTDAIVVVRAIYAATLEEARMLSQGLVCRTREDMQSIIDTVVAAGLAVFYALA